MPQLDDREAQDTTGLRAKTGRAVVWTSLGSISSQVVSFAAVIVMARLLTPEIFGTMAIAVAVIGLLNVVSDLGMSSALVQRKEITQEQASTALYLEFIASAIATVIVCLLSTSIAGIFHHNEVSGVIVGLALTMPLNSICTIPRAIIGRKMQMKKTAIVTIAASFISTAVGIIAAAAGAGIWALLAMNVTQTVVTTVGLFAAAQWRPSLVFRLGEVKVFSGFVLPLYGYTIANWLIRNGDNLMVGRYLGPTQLGYYSRGYNLLLLPSRTITGVVGGSMQISLSRIADDKERSRRAYLETCRHIAFLCMPMMLLMVVFTHEFVGALMGPQWLPAVPTIRALAIVGTIEPIAVTCGWIYFAQGRTDIAMKLAVFGGPFILGALYLGVRGGSASDVALAYLITQVTIIPILLATAGRLIGVKLRDFATHLWDIVMVTLVAAGLALAARQLCIVADLNDLMILILGSAVGVGAYGLLSYARKMPEIRLIGRVVAKVTR